MRPLLAFTAMYVCVYAGEPIKYAYLPIYMNRQLHFAPALSGAIIGIQPLVELALMPVAIIVARRTGMIRLTVIGAGFGVAANICFATTGTAAGLFAGQILMGGVWGSSPRWASSSRSACSPQPSPRPPRSSSRSTALSSALGGLAGGLGSPPSASRPCSSSQPPSH